MLLSPGTIISGTLKLNDLLDKFAHELALHDHGENKQLIEEALTWAKIDNVDGGCVDVMQDIINELSEKLNDLCPQDYYFGAHPDDGADFGVWKAEKMDWHEGYEEWLKHEGYGEWLSEQEIESALADDKYQFAKEQEEIEIDSQVAGILGKIKL